jgi:hypothetical protein
MRDLATENTAENYLEEAGALEIYDDTWLISLVIYAQFHSGVIWSWDRFAEFMNPTWDDPCWLERD